MGNSSRHDQSGSNAHDGKAIDLAGGELTFAKNYLTGFHINMWLADRLPGYIVTSPKPNVVRIIHDNNANDFTLDPSDLPLKTNGVSLANPDRPVQSELRFETWTEVAGVKFPARRANYHNGLKLGEITESITEVNMGLKPESLAAQPANFFPEIARDK